MMLPLPLGELDPLRRLELISTQTAALKSEARPEAGSGIFRFVAAQRLWYRLFPRQRSGNLVVSNAPWRTAPLYLAGAPLLEPFPMMPTMGNLTLVVAVMSYAGQLNLTVAADPNACPDIGLFTKGVRRTVEQLARSVHVPVICEDQAKKPMATDARGFETGTPLVQP
jgi:diacylglycerol O-acyltransferase